MSPQPAQLQTSHAAVYDPAMTLHTYVRPFAKPGIEDPVNDGTDNPAKGRAVIDLSWLDAKAFDDADRGFHCMMLCECACNTCTSLSMGE